MSNKLELAARLRAHVVNRGGLSKDENGNPVVPNGAWAMMLEAADQLERMRTLDQCIGTAVEIRGIGGRSNDYLIGFEDGAKSKDDSLRKLFSADPADLQ